MNRPPGLQTYESGLKYYAAEVATEAFVCEARLMANRFEGVRFLVLFLAGRRAPVRKGKLQRQTTKIDIYIP